MATLTFNGTTQYTEFGTLAGGLENLTVGDHTCVVLIKITTWGNFNDPFAVVDSTRLVTYAGSKVTNANFLAYDVTPRTAGDDNVNHGTSTTTWYMAAVTMATADTPDVIFHWRDHTANGAWAHTNGVINPGNAPAGSPGTGGFMQHGRWQSGDFFHGNIAVAAAFAGRLTNAQLDELKANDKTSDWWNCSFGRPLHLVEFNVAETSLVDLTGNSVRVAPAAAPALTGGDPDRWVFDGKGSSLEHARTLILPRRMGPKAVGPLFFAPLYKPPVPPVSTQQTIAVGQATETETANAIIPSKLAAIGQATETETVNVVAPRKSVTLGQAVETETANAIGHSKSATLGQAVETETANAIAKLKTYPLGQAVETETANAITPKKSVSIAQAVETETANTVGKLKTYTLGQALESEIANAITPKKTYTLVRADEIETAQTIVRSAVFSDGAGLPVYTVGVPRSSRISAQTIHSSLARGVLRTSYGLVVVRSTRGYSQTRSTSGRLVPRTTKSALPIRVTDLLTTALSKITWGNTRFTRTSRTRSTRTLSLITTSKTTRSNSRMTMVVAKTVYATDVYGQLRLSSGRLNTRSTQVVKRSV